MHQRRSATGRHTSIAGKIAIVSIALILLARPAKAQSYDFTISNDQTFCPQACSTLWVGSGTMTVDSANPVTILRVQLFPITSLTGTFNGQPITGSGLFWNTVTPISPLQPLLFSSGTNHWNIQMTDFNHPGTGQTGYDYQTNAFTPVSFNVSLAPVIPPITFTPGPPPLQPGTDNPPAPPAITQSQVAAYLQRQGQINVGLEIGVPPASAFVLYEIHRHWPHPREALPAGKF